VVCIARKWKCANSKFSVLKMTQAEYPSVDRSASPAEHADESDGLPFGGSRRPHRYDAMGC